MSGFPSASSDSSASIGTDNAVSVLSGFCSQPYEVSVSVFKPFSTALGSSSAICLRCLSMNSCKDITHPPDYVMLYLYSIQTCYYPYEHLFEFACFLTIDSDEIPYIPDHPASPGSIPCAGSPEGNLSVLRYRLCKHSQVRHELLLSLTFLFLMNNHDNLSH